MMPRRAWEDDGVALLRESARRFFQRLTQATKDWNRVEQQVVEFQEVQGQIERMLAEVSDYA